MSQTSTFIYTIRLVRPEALKKMTPKEEATIDEHFKYLEKTLADNKLILAGRCSDIAFGIIIFRAKSQKEAENFMRNDQQ